MQSKYKNDIEKAKITEKKNEKKKPNKKNLPY